MKKFIILSVMMICFSIACSARYYVGVVTTTVNLREGASTYDYVVCSVPKGKYVFINTEESENGFYYTVYIDKDEVGYISKKYVKLIEEVKVNKDGSLRMIDHTDYSYTSEIVIENACSHSTTIRIGGLNYKFRAYETRTITITPGTYTIQASAPGVIPYVGSDKVEGGYRYSWRFYTYTTRTRY